MTKEEIIEAREAVWRAERSLTTKGQAERIAIAALEAAERIRNQSLTAAKEQTR